MSITHLHLGGTLFIPASHKHLNAIVNEGKYPALKSLVIDFEDGLEHDAFEEAMQNIDAILQNINSSSPLVFLRAKDVSHLENLLELQHVSNIKGFVLAKFSLSNAKKYLYFFVNSPFMFMPSIEGEELFDTIKLHTLKELLLKHKENIVLVRYGLEDMLKLLRIGRLKDKSVFDISAVSVTLGIFIAIFKSVGFNISAGVYPYFKDEEGFKEDVKRDLQEGLFSKTIIHPSQIQIINELYKVTDLAFKEAKEIEESSLKVFNQDGKMAETLTMSAYSKEILLRKEIYGVLS